MSTECEFSSTNDLIKPNSTNDLIKPNNYKEYIAKFQTIDCVENCTHEPIVFKHNFDRPT